MVDRRAGLHARDYNGEFGELAEIGVDVNGPAMLFNDDVVAQREPEASAFAGGLGGEERIEHLRFDLLRNAGAVVSDFDLDSFAEILRRGLEGRFKRAVALRLALHRRVEPVGNQIEENAREFLRVDVNLANVGIEVLEKRD